MLDTTDAITAADDPNTPQKERAWAMHCQGLASPAISQRLGIPERTVRHWIATITSDLAADDKDQRATRLTLAIARKRHLSAAAWEGYERALAIEASQRSHTLAQHETNDANDANTTCASDQTARRALSVAVRFLRLIAAIDHDLAALESAFDEDCTARERQQLEDERDQQEREWERQCEEAREHQRAELERERFQREQARLDRAKEREREPRPPQTSDPARVERLRELDPEDRAPIINAYFNAYDTYHAARRAADRYALYLDGTLDPYLPTAPETTATGYQGTDETNGVNDQWYDAEPERPSRSTLLRTLSAADIAALTARLDAEEAAANTTTD